MEMPHQITTVECNSLGMTDDIVEDKLADMWKHRKKKWKSADEEWGVAGLVRVKQNVSVSVWLPSHVKFYSLISFFFLFFLAINDFSFMENMITELRILNKK